MGKRKVKVFIAEHCAPCSQLKELLERGQFLIDGEDGAVDLIDIETEEGFQKVVEYNLSGVPAAFDGKKRCKISVDEETDVVLLECSDGKDEGTQNLHNQKAT